MNPKPSISDQIESLWAHGEVWTYEAGAVLMTVGEASDRVFLLIEGQVEVWLEGDREPIAVREAPTALGEVGWVLQAPRSATIRARTPVKALHLDGTWLRQAYLQGDPTVLRFVWYLMENMAERLHEMNQKVRELHASPSNRQPRDIERLRAALQEVVV
ncbi:MAG: cyclic nucleotide-binding domain-containing protein [Acidobacteria bacterium]|nr:cyclic nucleotide-binding domain-containing protein [Acidobacteriota bacterium]MDW7983854.1 cyclic nucleotide-binding domain-containing protein [Acidobacteriota bacterium]